MSIIDKVCGKLGLMDPTESEDIKVIREIKDSRGVTEARSKGIDEEDFKFKKSMTSGNVVNLHTTTTANGNVAAKQMKVIVVEPLSFDDAQHVADHLKNRKPVVVNFENTDTDVAKRIIDFISGTTYALAGNIQKVGNNIFLCAPSNVDVSYTQQDENVDKVVMPWIKK